MVDVRSSLWGAIVIHPIHRLRGSFHGLRGFLIAFVGLALSASLALGAQPTSTGLANAALHAGKTVPVQAQDEETAGDENTDEDTESNESTEAGENCTTDPTGLTAEELAAMRHGSIVCWAAQQTEWPEWFSNHGAFVKCWAHQGKNPDAPSCTEDPAAAAPAAAPTSHGASAGHGQGKGHNK
jgi:hypothetical protein